MQKPTYIIAYNHNIGGVGMMDQQLDGIEVLKKILKVVHEAFS